MKIVVTAATDKIEGDIDPRFGRCPYLILADNESEDHRAVDNRSAAAAGGAGIATAQQVVEMGAQVVITGRIGPNAQEVLTRAGIEMITGCDGPVGKALESYRAGKLDSGAGVAGRPQGRQAVARGMGQGRGMGGRGMGQGMGQSGRKRTF